MIHKQTVVTSGGHRLRKMTKTQARNVIKNTGRFDGYICGNRVNPSSIAEGWHLGVRIETDDVKQFETMVGEFNTGLRIYTPSLGEYAHFYEII